MCSAFFRFSHFLDDDKNGNLNVYCLLINLATSTYTVKYIVRFFKDISAKLEIINILNLFKFKLKITAIKVYLLSQSKSCQTFESVVGANHETE